MEIYTRYSVDGSRMAEFKHHASAIATAARQSAVALRADWFINEAKGSAVHMLAHRDEAALGVYRAATQPLYDAIAGCASGANMEILDTVSAAFKASISRHGLKQLDFAYGLKPHSAALDFSPLGAGTAGHIEIYTRFMIHPGKLEQFKTDAEALLNVVREKDPATLRYDWFYDAATRFCVALDTYRDAPAMFTHMRNCHAAHAKLLGMADISTEFLGALSDEALQAVAKYEPFILPFHAGMKPRSSGAFEQAT